jgi:hypothetical protein
MREFFSSLFFFSIGGPLPVVTKEKKVKVVPHVGDALKNSSESGSLVF